MLKIEIEPYVLEPNEKQQYYIVVNDIVDDGSFCYQDSYNGLWAASLYIQEAYAELLKHSFDELKARLVNFSFYHTVNEYIFNMVFVTARKIFLNGEQHYLEPGSVHIDFKLESEEWKKPFTVKEFAQAVEESVAALGVNDVWCHRNDDDFVANGFGVVWQFDPTANMAGSETIVLKSFKDILAVANELLMQRLDPHSLISYFRFPDEIKTPCTQYLVYFAQFLKDLGIRAEVELTQQDSGATLFKVIPKDKENSLKAIRNALDAYLAVSSTDFSSASVSGGGDIALMQLQSNVMHLQSQLMLMRSSIQMKDATIEMLQLSNFQYKQNLSTESNDQSEDIIPGVVSVTKFESNGLSVNLAEILKRLKRKLGL